MPKKFIDIQRKYILYLIKQSNQTLSEEETILNETILRFCEINHKLLITKIKNIFHSQYKLILDLLFILFTFNYIYFQDLRYLNVLLKLQDYTSKNDFVSKKNKRIYKEITTNLLGSVSNSK